MADPVFIEWPGEQRRARAARVPHHIWESRKGQVTKWYKQWGLSREEIQKLLEEDGFNVTKDQLWRKMDYWELWRGKKGTVLAGSDSAAVEDDYSLDSDESADFSLVDHNLVAAPEAESSHGSFAFQLHSLPLQHDPSVFEVGTVVAGLNSRFNKHSIKLWLVVAPRTTVGCLDCIRIKSFGGRGIEGSLAAYYPQGGGDDVNETGSRQNYIDAHAILHAQGSPVPQLPVGLATRKIPLGVEGDPDLLSTVLHEKSCALFTTPRTLSCKSNLVLIGRLTKFSACLAEIYYKQIFEGTAGY